MVYSKFKLVIYGINGRECFPMVFLRFLQEL